MRIPRILRTAYANDFERGQLPAKRCTVLSSLLTGNRMRPMMFGIRIRIVHLTNIVARI